MHQATTVTNILTDIHVNTRFQCDEYSGTVKYIGPVITAKNHKTVFVGVQWDQPGRGKHDGEVGNVRYFSCPQGFGSFIHPKRIKVGRSFLNALRSKYVMKYDPEKDKNMYLISENSLGNEFKIQVDFRGQQEAYERCSQIEKLKVVMLSNHQIINAGTPNDITKYCPKIKKLDISNNLLQSWKEVKKIAEQLILIELQLSKNNLDPTSLLSLSSAPSSSSSVTTATATEAASQLVPLSSVIKPFILNFKQAFASLRIISLNDVPDAWECSVKLGSSGFFPQLQELSLRNNKLCRLSPVQENFSVQWPLLLAQYFPSLSILDLSENLLDWGDIQFSLSRLPQLHTLYLSNNSISSISINFNEKSNMVGFSTLTCLSLVKNKISDWKSFDALVRFPALTHVITQDISLENQIGWKKMRQTIIARMPRLKRHNRSDITKRERIDCEKSYLKFCWNKYQTMQQHDQSIEDMFPRYKELIIAHGKPAIANLGRCAPVKLSTTLLSLTLCCDEKIIKKRLPPSMKISKLKLLWKRLFKVNLAGKTLFYQPNRQDEWSVPLESKMGNCYDRLSDYRVQTGGFILSK